MVINACRLKWKRRALLLAGIVLAVIVLVYVGVQVDFRRWRRGVHAALESGSILANTDRGQIEYVTLGKGPPVLIMHGALGGYDAVNLFPGFPAGFQVVSPSRPGYLRTELSVGSTYEKQARTCAALLDSLGIGRVAVLGVSAGGPPAIQFAAQYPDRTWALVLVSAVTKEWILPTPEASTFRRVTDRVFGKDFADWLMVRAVMRFPKQLLVNQDEYFLSAGDKEILRQNPEKLRNLAKMVPMMGPWSLRCEGYINDVIQYGRMGERDPLPVSAPTLVIHGTADGDVDFSHAESVVRRIQGSELVVIEGAGHGAFLTHYEEIDSMVRQFLHKHAPSVSAQ